MNEKQYEQMFKNKMVGIFTVAFMVWMLLFILMPSFSSAKGEWFEPFSGEDWGYQLAFTAVTIIDWRQTQTFIKDPTMHEHNPALGEHPSRDKVDTYIGFGIIAHGFISYALPVKTELKWLPNPRRTWQVCWIGIEVGAVHSNYQAGIRISF